MKRYTLKYRTAEGTPVTLYNLGAEAQAEIMNRQRVLGSRGFISMTQPHEYSQQEIDSLRAGRVA